MPKIKYLENTVELTSAEFEKIMVQCPNYKYKTTSGYILKSLDSTVIEEKDCSCHQKIGKGRLYPGEPIIDAWCHVNCCHNPPRCPSENCVCPPDTANI